ncbi:Lipid A export ATP-binding/permease protein MsbA [Phycisphaerales bacterium]|nr:Lipid A export ATP-binding/permease protein MsbA [Phycisphaerales bacterium]
MANDQTPQPPSANPGGWVRPDGAAFNHFVRRLLRRWSLVMPAGLMVVISGITLSVGILGASPILQKILGAKSDLRDFAAEFNRSLASTSDAWRWAADLLTIPQSRIDALPRGELTALWVIMGALVALTIIGSAANFLHAYFSLTAVNRTVTDARRQAFRAALRAPLGEIARLSPSDVISRIVNDSTQLANGLNVLLSKAVLQIFKGVAALAVALFFDWRVTAAALVVTPVLYHVIRKLGKRIRRASGAALQSQAGLYGVAGEALGALRVVKANSAERREGGLFRRFNREMLRELNRVRTARALASPLTEMLSIFLLCGLVLAAGNEVIRGRVDTSDFLLVLMALAVAGASLKPLTGIINDIQTAAPAAERLKCVMDLGAEPGLARRLPRLPRHRECVEWRGVTFTYPGGSAPAVRDVSLRVPHGRRVAFVGPNGCGKTTLLSLLPRLFDPGAGSVLVDGSDISAVSVRSLRRQIGVVTQETIVFRGTVRENIVHAGVGVGEAEVIAAARKARAHDFIERLPRGYDTLIGEGGHGLSGGQRQRLAIARAILRDPAILILDEATSMIDAESEARIGEALAEFSAGRTALIVAHRLSTVLNCDSIVVMDHGRIVDQGRHEELLTRCDLYRQLARSQFLDGGAAAA